MSQGPSEASSPTPSAKNDGWWYPLIYVAAFVVIIIVNLVMVNYATRSFSGISTRDPYMTGNHYNGEIELAEAQKKLGWTSTLGADVVDPAPGQAGPQAYPTRLSFAVKDRDGLPIEGLTVAVEVRRPTQQNMDQHAELVATGKGVYSQVIPLPAPGQWEIRLFAQREGQVYRLNQRALIQATPTP